MKILSLATTHFTRRIRQNADQILPPRNTNISINLIRRWNHVEKGGNDGKVEKAENKPIKFSTSDAHLNYVASRNFYGEDRDLPPSHNYVLATSGILSIYYLIFLRDDIEADGGAALLKPLHEQLPQYAIPMLQAAIAENRKLGYTTDKLEKKLAEYMKEPEKHGGHIRKLVEN